MLTKEDGRYFKDLLSHILHDLSDKGGNIMGPPRAAEKWPDLIDAATDECERFLSLRISQRKTGLMRKVEQALDMIENGSYGICEICGEEIGLARLKARPVTQLCIQCKRREEAQERLRGL